MDGLSGGCREFLSTRKTLSPIALLFPKVSSSRQAGVQGSLLAGIEQQVMAISMGWSRRGMMLGARKLCSGHRGPAARLPGVLPWESPGSQLRTIRQCPTAGTALVSKSGLKAAAPVPSWQKKNPARVKGSSNITHFWGVSPVGLLQQGLETRQLRVPAACLHLLQTHTRVPHTPIPDVPHALTSGCPPSSPLHCSTTARKTAGTDPTGAAPMGAGHEAAVAWLRFPDHPQIQPTGCQCREQPAIYHLSEQRGESKMGSGARSTGLGRALSAWLK